MSEKINIIIAAQTNSAIKGLDQVSKSTQRVGQSVQNAQSKMGSFNKSVTAGNVNLRKFAMGGAQQAGYQIGDFAVQVANGTSKMQAFGQQAPQLLQIFGPIGRLSVRQLRYLQRLPLLLRRHQRLRAMRRQQ